MQFFSAAKYPNLHEVPGCKKVQHLVSVPPDVSRLLVGDNNPAVDSPTREAELESAVPFWHRLRPTQQEDVRVFMERNGLLIAHPCSAGKTLTGLAAAFASGLPALICAPAIARGVWQQEIRKWSPNSKMAVLRGRKPDKAFASANADFYFINYEVLSDWGPTLAAIEWKTIILDEAHEIRGRRTGRVTEGYRRAVALCCPRVIGLTATPIWNRIDGIWTLLDLIHPGWFGTYGAFVKRYMQAEISFEFGALQLGDASNTAELRQRLDYTIRRLDSKTLTPDLPDISRIPVLVENPQAAARLAAVAQNLAAKYGDAALNSGGFHSDAVAALRIALSRETKHKLPALREYLEMHPNKKVLVATQMRDSAEYITAKLKAHYGSDGDVYLFDGRTALSDRVDIFDKVRASNRPTAVVCTMASARQSIDASCMDAVAVLELPWTVEELIQFEGRIQRVTREEDVEAVYFVVDASLDKSLLDMLAHKLDERVAAIGGETRDLDFSHLLRDAFCDNTAARASLLATFGL
ncbi:MAG: DEAD/DEAH box helicase [Actinobacteria bacterium]|nr:DEAD/DEAH box helicase [Actinomycetota bacterium]